MLCPLCGWKSCNSCETNAVGWNCFTFPGMFNLKKQRSWWEWWTLFFLHKGEKWLLHALRVASADCFSVSWQSGRYELSICECWNTQCWTSNRVAISARVKEIEFWGEELLPVEVLRWPETERQSNGTVMGLLYGYLLVALLLFIVTSGVHHFIIVVVIVAFIVWKNRFI